MAHIFDGRSFAKDKEERLKKKVKRLRARGLMPKLDSIIVGDNPASVLYVNLKKMAALRVGAEIVIKDFPKDITNSVLIDEIRKLNQFNSVHGIMVQLPLPGNFSLDERDRIISSISPEKDVDGLQGDSPFMSPTTKAVLQTMGEASNIVRLSERSPLKILVVGSSGHEGKKIIAGLKEKYANSKVEILGVDSETPDLKKVTKDADVLISVTGAPDLIKKDMVKTGVVLVDVGSPKGDIEKAAYEKASFVSPVPGGVGPVTISCLLENLVSAAEESQKQVKS